MAKITLFLPILSFLVFIAESTLTPSKFQCSNSSYQIAFGPNATSPYRANLELVLSYLSSHSRVQGGYYNSTSGNSTDVVYGCFLCRGDLSADACEECVQNLTKTILQLCPKSKWAILWYDQCMVRYSDHNFFSSMEMEPYLYGYNEENSVGPKKFMAALETTMGKLVKLLGDKYGRDEKKYATMEAQIEAKERLYTMAECTPDMNVTGCRTCLEIASSRLQTIQKGKIGGRVMLPNCFTRFEIYSFYGIDWKGQTKSQRTKVILIVVGTVVLVIVCVVGFLLIWKKLRERKNYIREDSIVEAGISELHALQFPLCMIEAATKNFSSDNKLGEGGFGPVYKGRLPMGQEIAAKRLSRGSGQGAEEFKNEIELVAKLQHKNLVRLLGFSLERDETILVYEYVPNGSLDNILFDSNISRTLDWSTRHKILLGVARGLLYLHEDSRLKIIHRDLKASNILLDENMSPKISDFGMARIFCADQPQASTNRIVGTYGYMSLEYIMFGHFSTKSDVFSFGVLVLEIITGKKNSSFHPQDADEGLLGFVWKHWTKGTPIEVVDPNLGESYLVNEMIRCIHIGLLCVQDDMEDRPTMDLVVLMLNSDSVSLSSPQRPSFFFPSRKHKQLSTSLSLNQSTGKLSPALEIEDLHTDPGPR